MGAEQRPGPTIPRHVTSPIRHCRFDLGAARFGADLPEELPIDPPTHETNQTLSSLGGKAMPTMVQPAQKGNASTPADSAAPEQSMYQRLQNSRNSAFSNSSSGQAVSNSVPEPPATAGTDRSDKPSNSQGPTLASPRTKTAALPSHSNDSQLDPEPLSLPDSGAASKEVMAPPALISPAKAFKSEPATESNSNLLFAHKSPVLSVETKGPRHIAIGKEAAYEVTIQNAGEVVADEVVVFIGLPAWADVAGADASAGTARAAANGGAAEPFQWNVGRLEAKSRQKLVLRLVPRQSRPFDLAVRWDYKPAASEAMIEVQEPKLAVHLDGPAEVLYGKKELFKLKVSNTGTGSAENVQITLVPMGTSENRPVSHRMASLAAGEERVMEVELVAHETGILTIQVGAKADGGAHAELADKVLVRRAALAVAAEGPAMQYVGATTTYRIGLLNPGNATAKHVKLSVSIPAGAKYLSSSDGGRLAGNQVQWLLESLDSGAERVFLLKCNLGLPGDLRLDVNSTADEELAASTAAVTHVDTLANLRLEVKEPDGPVPVGEDTAYELRIRNRGTKNAERVEVVAYFSQGIEPTTATGAAYRITPGQVTFQPIPSLLAGDEVTLKIHARAETAGNHVFRAEVRCIPLGARLASEQTTYFYLQGPTTQQASAPAGVSPAMPARRANMPPASQTADRRAALPAAQPAKVAAPPRGTFPGGSAAIVITPCRITSCVRGKVISRREKMRVFFAAGFGYNPPAHFRLFPLPLERPKSWPARPGFVRRILLMRSWQLSLGILLAVCAGCGTTRWSDTQRTATEQLLISDAVDRAVNLLDFRILTGRTVYLDASAVKNSTDSAYLVSTLRQQLLAQGCFLREKREQADYIVEARSGAVGTDRQDVFCGVPATSVPTISPAAPVPAAIPEITLVKKTEQRAVAKIALFAYNRRTGARSGNRALFPWRARSRTSGCSARVPTSTAASPSRAQPPRAASRFPCCNLAAPVAANRKPLSLSDQAYFLEPRYPPPESVQEPTPRNEEKSSVLPTAAFGRADQGETARNKRFFSLTNSPLEKADMPVEIPTEIPADSARSSDAVTPASHNEPAAGGASTQPVTEVERPWQSPLELPASVLPSFSATDRLAGAIQHGEHQTGALITSLNSSPLPAVEGDHGFALLR